MPKRRSPADRAALDPDDVLAGRVKVSAAELLELIHRVNPTGRDLRAREAELRYALKSRLQSLLVRRFGPELEVVPDPEHAGTVSILHRGHGRDGCHAVLDALDEDARAWVQLQLDLGPPSTEAPPHVPPAERPSRRGLQPPRDEEESPSEDAGADVLLRRAEEAAASYDYERAATLLERAVAVSGGAPEPAAALLALLVDTLGDDAGALALQRSLGRAALARPDVRGLLALAEARAGEPEQAITWIRGASDEKASEALAALAARAVASGEVERAAGHLGELRRRDPAHPSVVSLGDEISRRRVLGRAPAEAELAGLVAAGREGEAERMAAEVLARWPESEAARRVIRAAEERQRRAEVDRLAGEADAAFVAGNAGEAKARLAQALAAARGLEREGLERRMREIEAVERAARDARAVERVVRLLDAADLREGLGAYLELDEALHARVREAAKGHGADAARWIDLTGRSAPQARIDAVVALSRALQKLAAGDAEAALAAIEPHHAALERVPEARQLAREARAARARERAARAEEALAAARVALAAGAPAEALRLLDEAVLRELPEAERAGAAALRAEAAAGAARAERIARLGGLRAAGKLFEARRAAEELAADAAKEEERARWRAERQAIQAAIQRELRVQVDEEPTPVVPAWAPRTLLPKWEAQRWLAPDGRSLVMAEAHGAWVEAHVMDLVDRTVRARVALRAPERFGHASVEVTGDTLWLLGTRGVLLGLSRSTWEVTVHRSSAEVLAPGTEVHASVFPVAEGAEAPRFLWVEPRGDEETTSSNVRVIDLSQRRPAREVPEPQRMSVLRGLGEPRVTCFRSEAMVLHEDRGTALPGRSIDLPGVLPVGAVLHPDGRGLVLLVLHRPAGQEAQRYAWLVVPEGGPPGALHDLEEADAEVPARIARSADAGIVVIHYVHVLGHGELIALGASADGLALLYRVPMPHRLVLAQDAGGRKIVLIDTAMDELLVFEVGKTLPAVPSPETKPGVPWIHHVTDVVTCLAYTDEGEVEIKKTGARMKGLSRANVATLTRLYQQRAGQTSDEGFSIVASLEQAGPYGKKEARRLLAWLWERYPDEPEARLHHANRLAREGRWTEVERLFDPAIDTTGPRSAHFYHLLGLAALHAGDAERARAMVDEALSRYPNAQCRHLTPLVALLAPPPDTPVPPSDAPTLGQLAGDARAADACLAKDDPAGALAALSNPHYWELGDVQLFARMAEAHLGIAPSNLRERFRKIMVLAKFVDTHEEVDPERRREMPLPGGTWNRARLDALAERARAWLDGVAGVEGVSGDSPRS